METVREKLAFFKDLCQKKDKEYQDIAYVQTQGIEECQRLRGEVEARDVAIANLKSELEAREVKQLNPFFPEPTPTPTQEPNTDNPVIESSPVTVTGISEFVTVGTPGLVDYINSVDPKSGITKDVIDNSLTRLRRGVKTGARSIPSLEATYNFKYLGQNGRNHQFSIPKL